MKRSHWHWVVVPLVALIVLLADQWSKAWVMRHLTPMQPWYPLPFLGDLVAFTYITNTGVAFGLLRDRSIVLVLVAFVVLLAVMVYPRYLPMRHGLVRLSLGLQLGGAAGNLTDRVRLGHVVDFIDLGIGRYRWFTSNLADVCIVTGVLILVALMLLERDRAPEEARS